MWQIYLPLLSWGCGFCTEVLIFLYITPRGGGRGGVGIKKKLPICITIYLPKSIFFKVTSHYAGKDSASIQRWLSILLSDEEGRRETTFSCPGTECPVESWAQRVLFPPCGQMKRCLFPCFSINVGQKKPEIKRKSIFVLASNIKLTPNMT